MENTHDKIASGDDENVILANNDDIFFMMQGRLSDASLNDNSKQCKEAIKNVNSFKNVFLSEYLYTLSQSLKNLMENIKYINDKNYKVMERLKEKSESNKGSFSAQTGLDVDSLCLGLHSKMVDQFENTRLQYEIQLKQLQNKLFEMKKLVLEKDSQIKIRENKIINLEDKLREVKESVVKEFQRYENKIQDIIQKYEEEKIKPNSLSNELEAINNKLDSKRRHIWRLQKELFTSTNLINQLLNSNLQLKRENSQLKENSHAYYEIKNLRGENKKVKVENDKLQKQNNFLRLSVDDLLEKFKELTIQPTASKYYNNVLIPVSLA